MLHGLEVLDMHLKIRFFLSVSFGYLAHAEVCYKHLEELGFRKGKLFDCLQHIYYGLSGMFSNQCKVRLTLKSSLQLHS